MPPAPRASLDVTTDVNGALTVCPVLDVDGAPVTAAAFIGSPAHGVAWVEDGLRLAPLDTAAPTALQRLVLRNETLVIPRIAPTSSPSTTCPGCARWRR